MHNGFYTDTQAEIDLVKKIAEENGAMAAYSQHWLKGGEGAIELAETVVKACEAPSDFKFLYDLDDSFELLCIKLKLQILIEEFVLAKFDHSLEAVFLRSVFCPEVLVVRG